ncbi:MAG: methyltransferase domain-containing protein [Terracidiphilus sp.]
MPHNIPDFSRRAQLTELMDEPCSREELRACLRDLARVNRWFLGYRPLLVWLDAIVPPHLTEPLRILDVGCGFGDGLRRIEQWTGAHGVPVELTGFDINPDTIAIAAEATPIASRIRWVAADVFAYQPEAPVDLVVSSLFTHHLVEADVVRFLAWMERQAKLGWFVNDLSRAAIPWRLFRIFSKLARLHRFVQHDGPVSIARSFAPDDWRRMCAAAGLSEREAVIQAFKPARLCVARRKPQ